MVVCAKLQDGVARIGSGLPFKPQTAKGRAYIQSIRTTGHFGHHAEAQEAHATSPQHPPSQVACSPVYGR